ncbi:MAG: hypothetical protein U1E78_11555 [Gammaproteobacteria bacterium]
MTKKELVPVALEQYQPFGIPMLKLMFLIMSLSLVATALYEIVT